MTQTYDTATAADVRRTAQAVLDRHKAPHVITVMRAGDEDELCVGCGLPVLWAYGTGYFHSPTSVRHLYELAG